ncbi:hypothetical protein D9757_003185 [Collybiopsis confluens]|uniref:Epoxide hydrolase N-terminal domain-containing protein n=1 Tax=Collybiopsis confluens TaxID=2823264 RepID=A0A8H5HYX7_9AGAR|nr:hypothetical protein D9757_003185 [Collybiopsis confluens]
MSTEQPFKIAIPDAKFAALQQKLALAEFPDELDGAKWDYGVPLTDVKRLVARWREGFNWRAEEAKINEELPQFTRDIDVDGFGVLNVHYVHKKSEVTNAIPLLFVHGWPGSFLEVRKILPLLLQSSPDFPSFHVVAVGLPGYGFSEAPRKPGFAAAQYAEVGHKLMLALGYSEYVTQGGDWGSLITCTIAEKYGGKHSKAWHTNYPIGAAPPRFFLNPILYIQHMVTPYTAAEKAGLRRSAWFENKGRGYFHEQSTQPQTLGYSLVDSPVGLLAWIYEKLVNWTDEYPWTDDEVLTWISLYHFSRAGPTASLRIYYEVLHSNIKWPKSTVPLGVSLFPKEIDVVPKKFTAGMGKLVFRAEHTHGGHFAATEHPEELVGDLRKMFGKKGPVYGIVPGKDGY